MNILFFGSEDADCQIFGDVSVDTTAGHFATGVACGLSMPNLRGAPTAWIRCPLSMTPGETRTVTGYKVATTSVDGATTLAVKSGTGTALEDMEFYVAGVTEYGAAVTTPMRFTLTSDAAGAGTQTWHISPAMHASGVNRNINRFPTLDDEISIVVKTWVSANVRAEHVIVPATPFNACTTGFVARFVNAAGQPTLRVAGANDTGIAGPFIVQTQDSAGALTKIGTGNFSGLSASPKLQRFSVQLDGAAVRVYIDGILAYACVATPGDWESTAFIDFGSCAQFSADAAIPPAVGSVTWSEPICSTDDTRSMALRKLVISGAGATSEWTGDADGATVKEITVNDATGLDIAVTGKTELFTQSPLLAFAAPQTLVGVGLNARASTVLPVAAPEGLELALRIGTTKYFSPEQQLVGSLQRTAYFWELSPDTSAHFESDDLTGVQIGIRSSDPPAP